VEKSEILFKPTLFLPVHQYYFIKKDG
jgi:hypothetical protein